MATPRRTVRSRALTPAAAGWLAIATAASLLGSACTSSHSSREGSAAAPPTSSSPVTAKAAGTTPPATSTRPSQGPTRTSTSATTTSAPISAVTPSPTPTTVRPVTLAFAGDVHFEGVDADRLAADPATAMGPIAGVLQGADLAMVNLETAITTRGTPAKKAYQFRAPLSAFTALRSAGVDVVTMANNHGEDYGPVGLQDTLAAAAAANFPVLGIGQDEDAAYAPYTVTIRGQRIAIIAATQVLDASLMAAWTAGPDTPGLASAYDVPRLLEAVRAARTEVGGHGAVIVYLHWGHELATCPTEPQRDIAQQLVGAGADIVLGTHAHVQLGAGRMGNAYIDYGLGNFVFYASGGGPVTRSGVLLLTIAGRHVSAARWVPAQIEGGVPVPLTGAAAAQGLADWNALRPCTGLTPLS